MVYGSITTYTTIKSFYLNNTKAKTFQITTPISYKRSNTSSSTGLEKIYVNSVNIRIYKNGDLYASSIPYETSYLLKVYSTSDLSPYIFFTTTALSYSYEKYLTNITFSFITDSNIRDETSASITKSFYEIKALVNWNQTTSVFLGINPNITTGFIFNTTLSGSISSGGSFTGGSTSTNYQSANLSDITTMNTVITNKIIYAPFIINTATYILSLANIQSLILLQTTPGMTNINISLPNNIDVSYSGSIIELRKHPYSLSAHTTTFTSTGGSYIMDGQTVITTSFTSTSSSMRLLYYVDANLNVYWIFLYRS